MAMTNKVLSISLPVADQDRAIAFYTEVLGFEVLIDTEIWPGARLVQVAPPGSAVAITLLPPGSDIPLAVRMQTDDAAAAHARVQASGVRVHNQEVVTMDGVPPMFFFEDPDGNGLVYLEREPGDD